MSGFLNTGANPIIVRWKPERMISQLFKCEILVNEKWPRYWSSRREAWPKMVPQRSSVTKMFGSRALERYRSDLTLLEAAERNDDGNNVFHSLLKQSSAALLNSYARKNYPYSAWEVKTLLIQALVSEEAAALQAKRFSLANEACN